MFASLETRLISALALIATLTLVLQFVTQHEAYALKEQTEALIHASAVAENADQFSAAVDKLRMATNRGLAARGGSDELTDLAIGLDDQLGRLRSSGMTIYGSSQVDNPFADLDRHIAEIVAIQNGREAGSGLIAQVEARNAAMVAYAGNIVSRAHAQRQEAAAGFVASVSRWQLLVIATGLVTMLVVLLALFDIMRNILPSMRRMHGALQALANGDLDVTIEEFRLKELKALSNSLETFRRNAKAVKNLAFSDPATGMPNRRAFQERVGKLTAAGAGSFAFMVIDIDRFKHINDDYGHAAGDELVGLIGGRVKALLGDECVVARVGGDEFAVCLPLAGRDNGIAVASDIVDAVRQPFSLGEYAVVVTVSMGVVDIEAADCEDIDDVLRKADMALYASKKNGRNCATAFDQTMAQERAVDRALEKDLELAFERDQLRMVYQPIHSMVDDVREVEALVRWRHPELGDVPPSTFIPAAERSGLMVRLGEWIIRRALADFAQWPDMHLSLNLSPVQLQHEGFSGFLLQCCRDSGIPPHRLFLEVTESLSIERNTRALLTLNLLRTLGFRIALDDFGTGYSSLSMVKSFKFDRMKLDRSLVMDLGQDPASVAVLEAAVTMARHVGAEVVAEGISEAHLIGATRSAGCTHLQGYYYSKPIEAGEVLGYFANVSDDGATNHQAEEGLAQVA